MPTPRTRPLLGNLAWVVLAVQVCAFLTACGRGMEGDCVARVRFDGVMYKPVYDINLKAVPSAEPLGSGEIVGCGTLDSAPAGDSVRLVSLNKVDPSVALLVPRGTSHGWQGLFVAEGLERSSWPPELRRTIATAGRQPAR